MNKKELMNRVSEAVVFVKKYLRIFLNWCSDFYSNIILPSVKKTIASAKEFYYLNTLNSREDGKDLYARITDAFRGLLYYFNIAKEKFLVFIREFRKPKALIPKVGISTLKKAYGSPLEYFNAFARQTSAESAG